MMRGQAGAPQRLRPAQQVRDGRRGDHRARPEAAGGRAGSWWLPAARTARELVCTHLLTAMPKPRNSSAWPSVHRDMLNFAMLLTRSSGGGRREQGARGG